jgi:hypothetical protein
MSTFAGVMTSIFGGAGKAFHGDAAECLHVLGGAVRHQRLGVFPLLDEYHFGVIGDALMQVVGDIAGLFAGFLDAGGRTGNEFGARFRLHGQCGNDVNHEILPVFLFWLGYRERLRT